MMDRYMEENRFLDASLMQIRQSPRQFATVEFVEALGDEVMRQDAEIERLKALLREIKDQCRMADMMQWPNKLYRRLCAALGDKE